MSTNAERSLGDEPETTPEIVNTSTVPPAPEDFDVAAWLAGIRPVRRSVKVRANGHLVARLEELAERISTAPDDADVDDLIDQFDEVKAQLDDGVWFTVEKRGPDWIQRFQKDTRAEFDLADDVGGNTELALHQIAAQIVEPAGVTADSLRGLLHQDDELKKLLIAMHRANAESIEDTQVLTLDFSQRRSTTGQDSSDN